MIGNEKLDWFIISFISFSDNLVNKRNRIKFSYLRYLDKLMKLPYEPSGFGVAWATPK